MKIEAKCVPAAFRYSGVVYSSAPSTVVPKATPSFSPIVRRVSGAGVAVGVLVGVEVSVGLKVAVGADGLAKVGATVDVRLRSHAAKSNPMEATPLNFRKSRRENPFHWSFIVLPLVLLNYCGDESRPTAGVTRWWAGRDNAALTEPA